MEPTTTKKQYNEGKGDLSKIAPTDMHTVAGLLKLYLRELPEPLLIWRYYSTFIKVIKNSDKLQRMLHLRMLIYGLPKVNRDLVLYLMTFLNKVSSFSSSNKMTSANLAMVFAPNLLRHQKESLNQIMEDSNHVTNILKHLIEEIAYISKSTHYLSTSVGDVPMALIPANPIPVDDLGNVLYARALYPYQTTGQWHLPFKKEDQITLLDIKTEEGWMKGELNGRVGYFPASYVEIVAAPPPTEPLTLIPIPDIDQTIITPDVTITTTTTTTTHQTTTTTTTTTTTIQKNNGAESAADETTSAPVPIASVAKKNSSGLLKPQPPPRTAGSPILATSTSGEAVPSPSTVAINKLNGSSSSLVNSPDITKIMSTKLSVSSSIPPPSLSAPPTLVAPPTTAAAVLQQQNSNSFLEFALSSTPPPPLSLPPMDLPPPPVTTPVKSPSSIDLANLPPPPFSPCSPEPNPLKQNNEMAPPLTDDFPPPPPLVFSQTSSATTTEDDHNPPTYEDEDDDSSSESNSFLGTPAAPASIPSPPPPPPKRLDRSLSYSFKRQEKMADEAKKRKERAEEMLSTERTYVKQLTCILELFIEPVKKNHKFALPEELLNTFSCLEVILNAHRANILKALEERMTCWDAKPLMGDIFCNNTSFIKLYKHYVNNYDRSITSLKQCKEKTPEFKAFVATLDYTEKFSGLNVESFLILPVQRIPRYVLLLQDLLKYTSNDHPDFDQLCEALGTIKDFAETINYKKSEEDNNSRIQQVQDSIKNLPAHALERPRQGQEKVQEPRQPPDRLDQHHRRGQCHQAHLARGNFETLLGCHITFYDIIKERLVQWEDKPFVSDLFIEKGGFLKLYNYYVQHHYSSLQTIESCIEKYPLFAIHLRNIESNEKVELKHLLAEPLRRIPRYYLILQEILQYTRPKQDDHENLQKVVTNLKDQNDKFNATSILALSSSGDTPRSPHKSKTIRVKPPKGLNKDSKLNTSGFFSV
ncbi:pleckstrin domain-containing protein [Cavenderia fasciculata]|uniref:Pleckstrin domain-containing protein n=1 Tax=Cavenderia fasciculata TaxID=261658 RepID=F4QBY7_CACFS|nr:pleckstrin domain-containing protein [Cavenderia fasciculata]EGG14725.1 pleckstrin domain-containing protein [Cavenderia fasciculata]|eukprot:XP_004351233.1 pleckstrin domain-containing protein [Cavenderia fasciculata]